MFQVGVVGHRYFADRGIVYFIENNIRTILKAAVTIHRNVVALSALAIGADTIFGETALSLGVPLRVIRPFENYIRDFEDTRTRKRYMRLRDMAEGELKLAYSERSNAAYTAAMNYIVDHSDLLIAVWDGVGSNEAGGTAAAVAYAVATGRRWIHLDVSSLSISDHHNNASLGKRKSNSGQYMPLV